MEEEKKKDKGEKGMCVRLEVKLFLELFVIERRIVINIKGKKN